VRRSTSATAGSAGCAGSSWATIHHIYYGGDLQGMGGRRRHSLDNLVSLCWLPGDMGCHERAHSNKGYWQPLLSAVINDYRGHITAFQLARWTRKKS
jgi:hypothetical protein